MKTNYTPDIDYKDPNINFKEQPVSIIFGK